MNPVRNTLRAHSGQGWGLRNRCATVFHGRHTCQMSADEYRNRHGLFDETSFRLPPYPDGTPRRRPRPCTRCKGDVFTRAKLCTECSATFWGERERRRQDKLRPRPRWRELTEDEVVQLRDTSRQEQPALVERLQADRVPSKTIGKILGLSQGQMSKVFPRAGWGMKKEDMLTLNHQDRHRQDAAELDRP